MDAQISSWLFILTTALTIWIFFKASGNHALALILPVFLAILSAVAAKSGFLSPSIEHPPYLILFPVLSVLIMITMFTTTKGRSALDRFNLRYLTMLHVVRIPVEIVLYLLMLQGLIPELMTFAGNNPDILSGLTAPAAVLLFLRKSGKKKSGLLIWNIICLILLFNIVILAVLSVPSSFQQLGFDRPNYAVMLFPYVWLPAVVVPLVLFSHLISIRQLLRKYESPVI